MFDLFLFLYNLTFSLFPTKPNPTYLVTQVIDGDTFQVDNLFYIRLTNIDAPEIKGCLGLESKDFLTNLILNKRIRITSNTPSPDGRILAQAYLGDKYINLEMIKSTLVQYTSGEYDQKETLKTINADNKSKKLGIFSESCLQTVNSQNPNCKIKGNLKEGHKIYSFPGCNTYNTVEIRPGEGDRWFCTEAEAIKAGFVKARNCN